MKGTYYLVVRGAGDDSGDAMCVKVLNEPSQEQFESLVRLAQLLANEGIGASVTN